MIISRHIVLLRFTSGAYDIAAMSTIYGTVLLDCPFSACLTYIEEFFNERHSLALKGMRTVKTDVLLQYELVADEEDTARLHDALAIRWRPKARLPLPSFRGSLTVRPHMTRTELRLKGGYLPPLGAAGKIFDAVVGKNIARDTIRGFLRQVKIFVESAWQRERSGYPDIETLNRRNQ